MSRNLPSFEVKKLSTIMNELGHKWVDVLKVPFSLASCANPAVLMEQDRDHEVLLCQYQYSSKAFSRGSAQYDYELFLPKSLEAVAEVLACYHKMSFWQPLCAVRAHPMTGSVIGAAPETWHEDAQKTVPGVAEHDGSGSVSLSTF